MWRRRLSRERSDHEKRLSGNRGRHWCRLCGRAGPHDGQGSYKPISPRRVSKSLAPDPIVVWLRLSNVRPLFFRRKGCGRTGDRIFRNHDIAPPSRRQHVAPSPSRVERPVLRFLPNVRKEDASRCGQLSGQNEHSIFSFIGSCIDEMPNDEVILFKLQRSLSIAWCGKCSRIWRDSLAMDRVAAPCRLLVWPNNLVRTEGRLR